MKLKKKKKWKKWKEKKQHERRKKKKHKKDIKAFCENLDSATKAQCGLRPLLCVQSQTSLFDLVHWITVCSDYNGYNFVDI